MLLDVTAVDGGRERGREERDSQRDGVGRVAAGWSVRLGRGLFRSVDGVTQKTRRRGHNKTEIMEEAEWLGKKMMELVLNTSAFHA